MKEKIHPKYNEIKVICSCGNTFATRSTLAKEAKNRSVDSAASEGGDIGWMTRAGRPEPVRKIIDILKQGVISPIVKIDSQYRIIQLLDRKEGEVEDFDKVKARFTERLLKNR